MAVDREATDAVAVRHEILEALKLHNIGDHTKALGRAVALARAHPSSAVALNLAGSLHQHAGVAAWTNSPPGVEAAASALGWHHHGASLGAFRAAAKIAPKCLVTALSQAKALAALHRYGDAQIQLCRALKMTEAEMDDPALNNVRYDLVGGSTEKARKHEAMAQAVMFMKQFAAMICHEVIPREAVVLLDTNKLAGLAGAQTRERAKFLSLCYPYSGRAQLLRSYIDLAQIRALDLASDKKPLLLRTLKMVSQVACTFQNSLVIALFHANMLFLLDDYDGAERECRRALDIESPNDPNEDDLPPLSVSGADYDARVCTVRKQLVVLLKQIIVAAAKIWCSMVSPHQQYGSISVKIDSLHQYYDIFDQSAAKTISDVRHFVKKNNSWSFWVCPHCPCPVEKFLNTESLWQHMCSKHREEPWEKLLSVLGPEFSAYASKADHSLDMITLCQDSGQDDIFRLPKMEDMFESLLFRPSVGITQAWSVVGMQQRKSREGSDILEIIKEKLRVLPEDIRCTEFEDGCFRIQTLWLKFLEISVFDYRAVIVPLARSFQWMEIKRAIARSINANARSIGDANIDAVFGELLGGPARDVSMENGSVPSNTNTHGHQNADNLQMKNLKASHSGETVKADEKSEESEVHAEDRNCSTIDQRSSGPPVDVHENRKNLAEAMADREHINGTYEYQPNVNVFSKNYADDETFILQLMMQSLCYLRHFRDNFLEPVALIPVDNPCIAQDCHEICTEYVMKVGMLKPTPKSQCLNKCKSIIFVDSDFARMQFQVDMENRRTLESYGLSDNSILQIYPKLLGRAKPPAEVVCKEPNLETLLLYLDGNVEIVETFPIPSTQTPNTTESTDELTRRGRRLARSLVDNYTRAWRKKRSWNGKVKKKHFNSRGGRAEITKEPNETLTANSWINDCRSLGRLLRRIFLKGGKNPPYMEDLINELETAQASDYNKKWFRTFVRYNLAFKSSLARGRVTYDIMRMYDQLDATAQNTFRGHIDSVQVGVWTTQQAQNNHVLKPTVDYQFKKFKKHYAATGFGCFKFVRNFDTHGEFPWLYTEIPIPRILRNFVSQAVKTLLKEKYPIKAILKDE
uniref:Uncharacterized protein n=1 Tax=Avena sativa TaxID=4498 RepID=A0ACD6A0F4_AVESA